MVTEFDRLLVSDRELESYPEYQAAVDRLMDRVLAENPPFLFLPGRSAELLGIYLLQRAKLRGQPFPIKLFTYPLSSFATPKGDYLHYLQLQVQQVADNQVYFMEDFVQGGGKIRMIGRAMSEIGLESHFFVLTSLCGSGGYRLNNTDIIFPGQRDLAIKLGARSNVGRRWNIDVPVPSGFPKSLN